MKKCFRKMHLKLGMEKGEWRPLQAKSSSDSTVKDHWRGTKASEEGARRKERKWKKPNTFHRRRDWGLETGELCRVGLLAHIPQRICESFMDLNGKVE